MSWTQMPYGGHEKDSIQITTTLFSNMKLRAHSDFWWCWSYFLCDRKPYSGVSFMIFLQLIAEINLHNAWPMFYKIYTECPTKITGVELMHSLPKFSYAYNILTHWCNCLRHLLHSIMNIKYLSRCMAPQTVLDIFLECGKVHKPNLTDMLNISWMYI